jgi:NAD(P)-dependent dehydrogenase (short-subunit alcohol dehydrogenase family)
MSSEPTQRLAGKRAVVIGAAGRDNMGQAIARRFRAEGAAILVAGRHEAELARFATELGGHAARADITVRADLAALAAQSVAVLGGVDIAVNATGWGLMKGFLETTDDELARMTALQFIGPFMFCQEMLKVMADGGSLIQISSATATIMLNDHAAYMGTKAGADHVIRCVANEFGHRGIRANSISPGLTDTPMNAAAKQVPGLFDSFLPSYPLGRIGTMQDIAAAAVYLAEDSCFITGQNLQVNGGLTLRRNPTREEMQHAIAAAAA